MRCIDFKSPGPPDVLFLHEVPAPEPHPDEVLVQVKAAGVNRPDIMQRSGTYPPPPGASPLLGLEIAGVVTKVGREVSKWKVGDAVCALTNGGGYAEYCAVPEGQCLPIPNGLSFVEAASLPENYFTVWGNLFMRTTLRAKETILIHAGASGIGSTAIQLAKATGAHVIATVGSAAKVAYCKELKADLVLNYQEVDVFAQKSVDVVLDILGGVNFAKNIELLREEGRLVQISLMLGSNAVLLLDRLLRKRLTIVGSALRPQPKEAKARIAVELLERVWPLFAKGALRPVVRALFSLEKAADAHRLMESNRHCGKIVLEVKDH